MSSSFKNRHPSEKNRQHIAERGTSLFFSHAEREVQVAQETKEAQKAAEAQDMAAALKEKKQDMQPESGKPVQNIKYRDSSAKLIFEDPILCAQFLRGYVDIPLLKDVQPEDITDETERFVHLFTEERDSDVVKRIRLKNKGNDEIPFYLISLIEHKAQVDYNVVMQILRYIVFIWEDYEKEQERKQAGVSRTKGFRYPPVLPIVYYEGSGRWTAASRLHERVYLSDMLGGYIPDYRCLMVQLNRYTNRMLMEKEDELSIVMMLNRLQKTADFTVLQEEVPAEYLEKVTAQTPEYLLRIIGQVVEILLGRLNVPKEEARRFADQVKERKVGELFANFKGYDVQATRREARAEGLEEGLAALVRTLKPILPDFDAVYDAVIKNAEYADRTRGEVRKYYEDAV